MSSAPQSVRIPVPGADALTPDVVVTVPLPPDEHGLPREALVLLDGGGALKAYVNRCKHLPIPIDGGSRQFLSDDGRHLVCLTHGAKYRRADGFCVAGPCSGESLETIAIERDLGPGGGVFLRLP